MYMHSIVVVLQFYNCKVSSSFEVGSMYYCKQKRNFMWVLLTIKDRKIATKKVGLMPRKILQEKIS